MTTCIELGSTKVVCLAAEADENGQLQVLATGQAPCKGLQRGVVADLDETAMAIGEAMRPVRTALGSDAGEFVVNISGSHLEGVNAQGFAAIYPRTRLITRDDVLNVINHSRQLMPSPDREQIMAIPREFRIDGQQGVPKPIGLSGGRLEVVTHIVTGMSAHCHNVIKAATMAGIKIGQVVAQPIASGLGASTDQERQLGCVVVDIGAGTTTVAVFTNGAIAYSAVIPVGSSHVTSDLFKLIKVSPEEAERLKIVEGRASALGLSEEDLVEVVRLGETTARWMKRRVLCEIIECRMKEIAQFVLQQVQKSGLYGMLPAGVILTGGGSQLKGAPELFASVVQHMSVRIGGPTIGSKAAKNLAKPELSAAFGLALYALEGEEEEIAPVTSFDQIMGKIKGIRSIFGRP